MGCCDFITNAFQEAIDFATGPLVDIHGDIIVDQYDFANSAWTAVWDPILEPIARPIFGLLGFTDETITNTQIQSVRLLNDITLDRLTANLIQSSNINASNSNIVLYSNLTGYKNNIPRYVQYARNSYVYSLPTGNLYNRQFNLTAVDAVITAEVGEAITVLTSSFIVPGTYVWAKYWMQENEPLYDYNTNTIFITPDTWDVVGATVNGAGTEITVQLENSPATSTYGPITSFPGTGSYYVVEYEKDSAPGTTLLWLYQESLGTHPTLDVAFGTTGTSSSNIVPITPIRLATRNINDDRTTEEYRTTRQLLKHIKFDINTLTTAATKQLAGDGTLIDAPNIELLKDIFVFCGVNLYGSSIEEKFLLYQTFNSLEANAVVTQTIFDNAVTDGTVEIPINVFTVQTEHFNYALSFNYITKTNITGVVAPVGFHDVVINELANVVNVNGGNVQSYVLLRHQFSATEFTEILVDGLHLIQVIQTDDGAKASAIHLEDIVVGAELTNNQKNFLIPISDQLFRVFSPIQADKLFSKSAHILIYAADSVELQWYETPAFTEFFSILIKFVAIVMYLFDWSGSATSALWALAELIILSYVFEYVLRRLFLHYSDNEDAQALIAITAVVVAVALPGTSFGELSTAAQLIAGVQATATVTNVFVQAESALLAEEMAEFTSIAESYQEEIQAAQDFLDVRSPINPNVLLTRNNIVYESPTDFYTRTLNTAPGQLVFDQLHKYVDNNLNLEYI